MGIILGIAGICIALFSVGLALLSFTYTLIYLPTTYISSSIIKAYWICSLTLMYGAPLFFLLFGASRWIVKYKIIRGIPVGGDMTYTSHLGWWRIFLLLNMPLDWGEVRAEVRYRYGEVSEWRHAYVTKWKQQIGVEELIILDSKVSIKGATHKFLSIFEMTSNGQIFTIHPDRQALPSPFEYKVSLIRNADEKILDEYYGSYKY